jgi:glycosyltransferase involved in cell wall biosynthesis
MPVYNSERYLSEAIKSMLDQSFTDFEFIIIDDGSNDGSPVILKKYAAEDRRVKIATQTNQGIIAALNKGINMARGAYIARMDADDISFPQRLKDQVEYLKNHPECVALGARVQFIDPNGFILKTYNMPCSHDEIFRELLRGNGGAIVHPVAMFRKEAVLAAGGYRKECRHLEDYDLYTRLAEKGRLANLPDILLKYRLTPTGINYTKEGLQRQLLKNELARQFRLKHNQESAEQAESPDLTKPLTCGYGNPGAIYRQWSFFACEEKRWPIAWKYALLSLLREPWERAAWKCFGYVSKKRFGFM